MSRTVDKKRPGELLRGIVRYVIRRGLGGLSLRPLAKALGCTPRVLLYHFGSKENMLSEVFALIRRRQSASYDAFQEASPGFGKAYMSIWKYMTSPDAEPEFRLFFEAYGMALRQPRLYRTFLHDTVEDWLGNIADPLCRERYRRKDARGLATVILAGFRGFMLDFCSTHDRERLDHAVRLWLRGLQSTLPARKAS